MSGVSAPSGPGKRGMQREVNGTTDMRGAHGARRSETQPEPGRYANTSLARRGTHEIQGAHTSRGGARFREQQVSRNGRMPGTPATNSPIGLSSNSSKSSLPYKLSQRKQLRLEEKTYLKEVKRSIAEGRVPQVWLQQNNTGHVVQYKTQFLNALKLAALAIVPNADIDIKNPSTMQEIMSEVKRQFKIERPLQAGMVAGFLQRLYKRNRAVYRRHWTLHGDKSRPDDCAPTAWVQLVDCWKSKEGSKECERNKANATAKKVSAIHFLALISWCSLSTLRSLCLLV